MNGGEVQPGDWYDYPYYYDIAMRGETGREVRFLEGACRRFVKTKRAKEGFRFLEPACGSGRVLAALARRGHQVVGYDQSPKMVEFTRARFQRARLPGKIELGDMRSTVVRPRVDAIFNLVGSIRHLTHEELVQHLDAAALSLRPGGIYVLGVIVVPIDSTPDEGSERWTENYRGIRVTVRMDVLSMNMFDRTEVVRTEMRVRHGKRRLQVVSEAMMQLYTPQDLRGILSKHSAFEILHTYDFWYDLAHPEPVSDRFGDVVYLLRKKSSS